MDHIAKQIRDGIKARLEAPLSAEGVSTYSGRITRFRDAELDAVNIIPPESAVTDASRQQPPRLDREFDIAVAILISGRQHETLDRADEIAVHVERLMCLSPEWSLPVRKLQFIGDDLSRAEGADGELLTKTLRYVATAAHPAGAPDQPMISAQPVR
ncbi:hypothetical protein [Pelagibacterium sp.]|uniref:hypothetical protein n=1 Tax=Pelagibacterium sp. TaxID=1967288 RepID=UPI003A902258